VTTVSSGEVARIDAWIPTRDGVRLSARIWLPGEAEINAVPAILEYIPYRKDDATAPRDELLHGELARRGFACVRVDTRGCGSSTGILGGEYLQDELDDGVEAIAWLAAQHWCNGRVGVIGKSWGGFNGLQIAALAPPALRCVVSVCSTDDRYRDDVHYTGGCVFAGAALSWATTMLAYTARPPDPAVVGPDWSRLWQERLEAIHPFGHDWLTHQRRDTFWKHGSVCENPSTIDCPVYMVGGWADPYRGAALRMLAAAPDRVRSLIGPWAHVYPHQGAPTPAVDFLGLCEKLFARHLADVGGGLEDEPPLRAWLQEPVAPRTGYETRPGRWVAERFWPRSEAPRRLYLTGRALATESGPPATIEHLGTLAHGSDGPSWLPWGAPGELAGDQRAEDGRSVVFDGEPLEQRVEILGETVLHVEAVPAASTGQIVARLCDVAPDGSSTLVTFGVLNLCHAAGHESIQPLVPGEPISVAVPLTAIGYAFPAEHRIRLALSSCYWPWAWPAPESLRLGIRTGPASYLDLPAREPSIADAELEPLSEPPTPKPSLAEQLAPVEVRRSTRRDTTTGRLEAETEMSYFGAFRLPDGLVYSEHGRDGFSIVEDDPLTAAAKSSWEIEIGRGTWQTRVIVESSMHADAVAFELNDRLEAFCGEELVASRSWAVRIARDLS
jgi:putative CocE/NonD family hydrolase